MNLFQQRSWRDRAAIGLLGRRLDAALCPLEVDEIIATANMPNLALAQWARSSMLEGVMLRSSQSERLARGEPLELIARRTGISLHQVLYYLTRFEWEFSDEEAVTEFYNAHPELRDDDPLVGPA